MFSYGKKNTVRVFLAGILVGLIMVAAFAAGSLVVVGVWYAVNALSQLFAWVIAMVLAVVLILCLILIAISLSPVKYLVVIEDIGAVQAVLRAHRFSMDNKTAVFAVWLITAVIGILFSGFNFLVGTVLGMLPLAGPLLKIAFSMMLASVEAAIIYPLLACWWTRLCMGAAEKKNDPIAPNLEAAQPASGNPSSGQFYV
jgi:Na+/phosphate symporter